MSANLFKKHSIEAVEQAIAKALTELMGREITVAIGGLQIEGHAFLPEHLRFSVDAVEKRDLSNSFLDDDLPG